VKTSTWPTPAALRAIGQPSASNFAVPPSMSWPSAMPSVSLPLSSNSRTEDHTAPVSDTASSSLSTSMKPTKASGSLGSFASKTSSGMKVDSQSMPMARISFSGTTASSARPRARFTTSSVVKPSRTITGSGVKPWTAPFPDSATG
jgi:hypothetical protein